MFLILLFCFALALATNSRARRVGCALSATQTDKGHIVVRTLDKKTYNYKKISNVIAFALILILWALTAFRASNIGNDTNNYIKYFIDINSTGISSEYRIEYGFQALCLFVGLFTEDPQMFLIVCATFCYLGVGYYAFKYSKNILVTTILIFSFCFSNFTNILRQDIAMVICLFAYQAIKDKRNLKALIYIILAICFHKTAAICLVWFFYKFVNTNMKLNLLLAFLIVLIGASGILGFFLVKFGIYANYAQGKYAMSGWLAVGVGVVQSLFFYGLTYAAYKNKGGNTKLILVNCIFMLFINCSGFGVNLFTRGSQYFAFPLIVELPNACYDGDIKYKNRWLMSICFVLLMYFIVILIFRPEWNNLYPYSFFWN